MTDTYDSDDSNSVFPYRSNYQPADFRDRQPIPVNASAITTGDDSASVVGRAQAAIINAEAKFKQHLASIDADAFNPDGLHKQITMFVDTVAANAIDSAVADVRQRADEAGADVSQLRRDLSPELDAAAELRASRYWHRTERRLDRVEGDELATAAQDLITGANITELGILMQEVPAYLASRGHQSDWVDYVVADRVPELPQAQHRLVKAEQARTIVEYNAERLRTAFADTRAPNGYRSPLFVDPTRYDPDR
jgi:hypothetical protein